jgi:quinol monooxygenase YgiN
VLAVIYRFKVKPGMEDAFVDAWHRLTVAIRRERGSLGSRLHRADDGAFVAYAQWPDRELFQRAGALGAADEQARDDMRAAMDGPVESLLMTMVDDLLEPPANGSAAVH